MACATLKRSLDFDPVHNGRQTKRRRCSPLQCVSPKPSTSTTNVEEKPSIFEQNASIRTDRIAADLSNEIRRLQRLNKLKLEEDSSKDSSSSQDSGPESPDNTSRVSRLLTTQEWDRPLYTLKQVEMICEQILKEREVELREEYERILHSKLADQYEQFVKFTTDQLHRYKPQTEPPSYLS
ncbi:akirin-2-like [Cloeon dipterum]|uniref:akirin-2-like n=1 Tax=Cloeon dipterum TaxID=197152 RepID=UPI00321FCD36